MKTDLKKYIVMTQPVAPLDGPGANITGLFLIDLTTVKSPLEAPICGLGLVVRGVFIIHVRCKGTST